jgi:endonuclease G
LKLNILVIFTLSQLLSQLLFGDCNFYYSKPIIDIPHLTICNTNYVTEYSLEGHHLIYSADILTKDIVDEASKLKRVNSFHDTNVTKTDLKYYIGSEYDRGHIVPCDDMPTTISQYESFSMANMVPQNVNNNRGLWKKLENEARSYTKTEPKVYVISGPIYENNISLHNLNNLHNSNIQIPTKLFKIIMLPSKSKTIVYVVDNKDNSELNVTTLGELQKLVPLQFNQK